MRHTIEIGNGCGLFVSFPVLLAGVIGLHVEAMPLPWYAWLAVVPALLLFSLLSGWGMGVALIAWPQLVLALVSLTGVMLWVLPLEGLLPWYGVLLLVPGVLALIVLLLSAEASLRDRRRDQERARTQATELAKACARTAEVLAYNTKWREVAKDRQGKDLPCPHCGEWRAGIRCVDCGGRDFSYFICLGCGRSFDLAAIQGGL